MTVGFLLKQRRRLISHANAKSKSEKFPPPHQDGQLGFPLGASHHIDPANVPRDAQFTSTSFTFLKESLQTWSGPLGNPSSVHAPRRKKQAAGDEREPSKLQTGGVKYTSNGASSKGKNSMA